jgi:competence protein ComEC
VIEDLFQRLHRASFPVRSLSRHDQVTLAGGAAIRVLLPDQRTPYPNDNANSIVLSIELGGKKILLPGDLEGEGLDSLLGMPGDDWDVVLLPHHGSKNSRPRDFTRWSSPEYAVISAARNTLNGEVVQEVASHKCRVFSTADFGSLRLSFDGSRIKWDCWSYNRWITFPEKTHHSSSVRY